MKQTITTGPKRRRYKRRDGNESVRKGLGCTNRSVRMDWFSMANVYVGTRRTGTNAVSAHPTANKIARQAPID